jgi:hypothetical protein
MHLWHPWLQTPDNRQVISLARRSDHEMTLQLEAQNPQHDFGFMALRQAAP